MDQQKGGGPAFPVTQDNDVRTNQSGGTGMTLRDYFAAKVMQGAYANSGFDDLQMKNIADMAYAQADAMLAAREGT